MIAPFEDIPVRQDMQAVAFYNVENLFDLKNNKLKHDNDFLPGSIKKWTQKRYHNKLRKIGYAISNIGRRETGKHPALVGLAEVENASVLKDLITSKHLKNCNYNYIHFESKDERGIDVALLYDTKTFKVTHSEAFAIVLTEPDGSTDYTRDVLLVSGVLDNENVHVIVNHWSSRREGQKETEYKRLASSKKVSDIIETLKNKNEDAKILVLGDFNDTPQNLSLKRLVDDYGLYNPMETLRSFTRGSVKHRRQWFVFDQILVSINFFRSSKNEFEFFKANIFDEPFLKLFKGPYKGSPYRTYAGPKYQGGYSDHFPVYVILKK
ncbi:endonuclease [Algibacter amylolyticus]|uniref:Endonuclease n=1 Tax=Algibacter amylolyticus TaxID=1608400 RepID=A0A5M7AU46_9FLAO|nr:endonuclease [Algibacter amylolyticus]KAA5820879.1 endonuclease [Algibacter amylolyticus]MBB5269877.1 putative extracellular nuclease [Algibacter amylolyticus]TSJ71954.1 endonuclease [Algibacter amylolyticus]